MNAEQAKRLSRIIAQSPGFTVTGQRHYGGSDYGLDVVCTETGDRLVIDRREQWQTRLRDYQRGMGLDWF